MKKNIYIGGLAIAVFAVGGLLTNHFTNQETAYSPRVEDASAMNSSYGVSDYWNELRANQYTGVVDPRDVREGQRQVMEFERRHSKASFPFSWSFAGPDNVGGRTRAFMIDRNDNNVLYAGGVMGGLFKSTNKGASWYPVDDQFTDMAVSTVCQTVDGTIYFGTGEWLAGNSGAQESFSPAFGGGGIYKSTDNGVSFTKIPSTANIPYTTKLVAHPTKNIVFAATSTGLRATNENDDATWNLLRGGNFRDFQLDKNGNALAYSNIVYRSTNPTDGGSYNGVNGLPVGGVARAVVAFSESDPNYAYVVLAGPVSIEGPQGTVTADDGLLGIYQSKDNGENFSKIVGSASSFFAPFTSIGFSTAPGKVQSQANWDMCVAVHPQNKERIFIGGVTFAEWTPETGPIIVGNTNDFKTNPVGIHADKHLITFDTKSNPIIMYVTSDGGVAKTTNAALNNYTSLYNGYATTQFYGLAAGTNGIIVGGTQDNNTMVIDGKGNTPQAAFDLIGGDGFQAEVSRINPDILFGEQYYGIVVRSNSGGTNGSLFFDERISNSGDPTSVRASDNQITRLNSIFNTPIDLYENLEDSTNRFFTCLDNSVWVADEAVTSPNPLWYCVGRIPAAASEIEVTADGNSAFVGGRSSGSNNWLRRIDGLNKMVYDTALLPGNTVSDSLTITDIKGNLPNNRYITDIEVDQSNPNRVIVTLGNYGNSSYVYISENALDADPTWTSIQGSLPQIPVYDAEISVDNPNVIILGTEYGIYYTQNGGSSSPTWTFNRDSFPRVPVLQIRQVESKVWKDGSRTGAVLYAGTHGRGIWKSTSTLTSVRNLSKSTPVLLKAYPNPVQNSLTIDMPITNADELTVEVVNYQGQVLRTKTIRVTAYDKSIKMDVASLSAGNYLVSIKGRHHNGAAKFIKID